LSCITIDGPHNGLHQQLWQFERQVEGRHSHQQGRQGERAFRPQRGKAGRERAANGNDQHLKELDKQGEKEEASPEASPGRAQEEKANGSQDITHEKEGKAYDHTQAEQQCQDQIDQQKEAPGEGLQRPVDPSQKRNREIAGAGMQKDLQASGTEGIIEFNELRNDIQGCQNWRPRQK
jgi:hypothetical protein